MPDLILIHWNEFEGQERLKFISENGYSADLFTGGPPAVLRNTDAGAFLIDLSRLPSQGQAFAVSIRQQKTNRGKPLVFVGGAPEKVEKIRALLPDAAFCDWETLLPCLADALAHPPAEPLVPGTFDSYAGAPLAKKLGIRAGSRVFLLSAPEGFDAVLGSLPDKARLSADASQPSDVVLVFSRSLDDLRAAFPSAAEALAKGGKLWLAWPKKQAGSRKQAGPQKTVGAAAAAAAAAAAGLDHDTVQRFGLDSGFMDYKICAIDQTWSALCFTRKKQG